MFCESLLMMQIGVPPTVSGVGASTKHSHAAPAVQVPLQSLLSVHDALLLHLSKVEHVLEGQSAFVVHSSAKLFPQ